jgi:hypothetical protein
MLEMGLRLVVWLQRQVLLAVVPSLFELVANIVRIHHPFAPRSFHTCSP